MPRQLVQVEIDQIKAMVEEYNQFGNTPDYSVISSRMNFTVTPQMYERLTGKFRWSTEQKEKLRQLWVKHCNNFDIQLFVKELSPLKAQQIRKELKFLTSKDSTLKKFE